MARPRGLKNEIQTLKNQGLTFNEIVNKLQCSKATVSYHLSDKQKKACYRRLKNRRKNTGNRNIAKQKLIDLMGGKCCICQYDRCNQALEFHHLNPNDKKFGISSVARDKPLYILIQEIKKCILVCSNCHREIENGLIKDLPPSPL